jgi:GTPase SAR1 family protein
LSLRKFAYAKADVIVLCFSILDPSSFQNLSSKWMKEIKSDDRLKTLPIILAQTKSDKLCDQD